MRTSIRQTRTSGLVERHRDAFTLIELLVVVAIISLLVSILIPSLQKAKELAKQTVCQSKLRSLATIAFLYANEHQDMLPPATEFQMPSAGWIRWYIHLGNTGYIDANYFTTWEQNPLIWCVADPENITRYAMSYDASGIPLPDFTRPSEIALFFDGGNDRSKSFAGRWSGMADDNPPGYIQGSDSHFKGINIALVDGHVDWKEGYIPCWCNGLNPWFDANSPLWP